MSAQSTRYAVDAESQPGGAATISSRASTLAFDGSAATGELLPGPADLLAAALAACILKKASSASPGCCRSATSALACTSHLGEAVGEPEALRR